MIQQQSRFKTVIPQTMVDEAILMSQMFELNELLALELIIAGENQESRYPGMTRGPIAVLLYYDGRRSLLHSLRLLVEGRSGKSWCLKLQREVDKVITNFSDELKDSNVVMECIEQLFTLDINAEFEMLLKNRGLGSAKYRRDIFELMKEIRKLLAEIIYCYAAQTDLKVNEILRLIELIAKKSDLDSQGKLDSLTSTLLLALFHVLDVSCLQTCEENDPIFASFPLVKYRNLHSDIQRTLSNYEFNVPELKTIINFVLSIDLKVLSILPISGFDFSDNDPEKLLDKTIDAEVFDAMNKLIASNPNIYSDKFYMRRIHCIFVDFITLMPIKVKELRDKGDEIGRIMSAYIAEGIQPPANLPRSFEKFLLLLSEFYTHDRYSLSLDFWKSNDEKHSDDKQFSLFKFIRSVQDAYLPPILHKSVIQLLSSLAVASPFHVFSFLKMPNMQQTTQFSLDNFFLMLSQYLAHVRGLNKFSVNIPISNTGAFALNPSLLNNATDIETLCALLGLIENLAKKVC